MSRPLLLDLFCGAGGAAVGYHRAGFDVVGVDIKPQPHYPFTFIQGDALAPPVDLSAFDVIHASPPCQAYTRATAWRGRWESHPDLLPAIRRKLRETSLPFVIENVREAKLHASLMLCGSMFGVRVQRHRYFESNVPMSGLLPRCDHAGTIPFDHGGTWPESMFRDAVGPWMTVHEAREAIPPAYTQFIGEQLLEHLARDVA